MAKPSCAVHTDTELVCPKCEAAKGGKTTAKKHAGSHSEWGKKGGRPKTRNKGAQTAKTPGVEAGGPPKTRPSGKADTV
jgi:hypothetical protein